MKCSAKDIYKFPSKCNKRISELNELRQCALLRPLTEATSLIISHQQIIDMQVNCLRISIYPLDGTNFQKSLLFVVERI